MNIIRAVGVLLAVVAVVIGVGWLGLQIQPAAFPAFVQPQPKLELQALPSGLPVPVERYYRKVYGDRVPIITSAVITGKARFRIAGLTFPGRFRFTHNVGRDYRHYLEATWFGVPIFKVNEGYVNGRAAWSCPSAFRKAHTPTRPPTWGCGRSRSGSRRFS